jgi:hypothetical protein
LDAFLLVLHWQGLLPSQAGNVLDYQNVELHQKQPEQETLPSLFGKTQERDKMLLDAL